MKVNQANVSSQNINNNEKRNNALINSGIIVGSTAIGGGAGYIQHRKEYKNAASALDLGENLYNIVLKYKEQNQETPESFIEAFQKAKKTAIELNSKYNIKTSDQSFEGAKNTIAKATRKKIYIGLAIGGAIGGTITLVKSFVNRKIKNKRKVE